MKAKIKKINEVHSYKIFQIRGIIIRLTIISPKEKNIVH